MLKLSKAFTAKVVGAICLSISLLGCAVDKSPLVSSKAQSCPFVYVLDGTQSYILKYKTVPRYRVTLADVGITCNSSPVGYWLSLTLKGRIIPITLSEEENMNIKLPIRVAVLMGDKLVYSSLFTVDIMSQDNLASHQFVEKLQPIMLFNHLLDPDVAIDNLKVLVGYDYSAN